MSDLFSGSELIKIAIGIERSGIAFYDVMTKSADNAATRDVFEYLVTMEREHLEIFQDMLADAEKYEISGSSVEECAPYIQALVDSAVFTDEMVISEMATEADSDSKALELAIGAEKDSLLFYYEMKDMASSSAKAALNEIIAEEKSHLRQLSELKRNLL